MKVLACPGGEPFSVDILKSVPKENVRVKAEWITFKNQEVKLRIQESIRGRDVYIVQDVANIEDGRSINDRIMELFVAVDTVRHSSPSYITVILPTYPYARQHKKVNREGLTAAWFAHTLESMGVRRVITLDLHSSEICNAFHISVLENLHASYQLVKKIVNTTKTTDLVMIAADTSSASRVKYFADMLECPMAIVYKERNYNKLTESASNSNITKTMLLGDVKDKDVVIIDDLLCSGGTLINAAKVLKENGAKQIVVAVSLAFFSGNAVDEFQKAIDSGLIYKVISTNATYKPQVWARDWFVKADIAKFIAEVITRLSTRSSISELLDSKTVVKEFLSNDEC